MAADDYEDDYDYDSTTKELSTQFIDDFEMIEVNEFMLIIVALIFFLISVAWLFCKPDATKTTSEHSVENVMP